MPRFAAMWCRIVPTGQRKFAHRHAVGSVKVDGRHVLHSPAGHLQQAVDLGAGSLFGALRHGRLISSGDDQAIVADARILWKSCQLAHGMPSFQSPLRTLMGPHMPTAPTQATIATSPQLYG